MKTENSPGPKDRDYFIFLAVIGTLFICFWNLSMSWIRRGFPIFIGTGYHDSPLSPFNPL